MNFKRFTFFMAGTLAAAGMMSAQSYFDDDIYYNPAKATPKPAVTNSSAKKNTVVVYDYPAADTYTVNGTRSISVDDYNRRGIFANDSLTADSTATDFAYTRRIEQFYNPEIVSGSGDQELANIYYMEPDEVNIYINTPSGYWGYDYFYPYSAWNSPYWYNNYWRWNSSWYWGSWYDPYWAWNWGWGPSWGWGPTWGPSWAWGPSWGWGPGWGPAWGGPSWGGGSHYNPRHPGAFGHLPNGGGSAATGTRPGYNNLNGNRHSGGANNNFVVNRPTTTRPGATGANGSRPGFNGTTTTRPATNGTTTRPSINGNNTNNYPNYNNNSNNTYNRPTNTNGGRYNGGSFGGGSRGGFGGGSTGGGSRSSGGGRGRH